MKLNKKQRIVGLIVGCIMLPVIVPLYLLIYVCGVFSVILEAISLELQDFDTFTLSKFYYNIIKRFK
jgi:uncharacterized membrane protein